MFVKSKFERVNIKLSQIVSLHSVENLMKHIKIITPKFYEYPYIVFRFISSFILAKVFIN